MEMFDKTTNFSDEIRQRKSKSMWELQQEMDLSWLRTKNYEVINTWARFDWALRKIKDAPLLAIDTETTGLNICDLDPSNPLKDRIVGMSISWERNQGIYIPFEHVLFNNLDKSKVLRALQFYLENKSIVTHNGLFDGKVFYDEGIILNITQDTMLMHFNLDSTVSKGSKGLKGITRRLYNYDVIELGDIFESERDAGLFRYVEFDVVKAYACADSDHTLMVFLDTFEELLPGQVRAYRLDIRTQNNLIRSEYCGKGIDMDLFKVMNDINTQDMSTIEKLIYEYVGTTLLRNKQMSGSNTYRFNVASTYDLQYVIFDLLKCEPPPSMKEQLELNGKISVDKHTLKALDDEVTTEIDKVWEELVPEDIPSYSTIYYPNTKSVLLRTKDLKYKKYKIAALVTIYRKLEKLRSSFFNPLLENNYEGRYYSSIKMTRAETARLVDFIQTMDKAMKKLIVPLDHSKGAKQYIVDFDFAQIEYRVMAGEAGLTDLVKVLRNSEADYHREGGSALIETSPEDMTKEERSDVKTIHFAIPYGMGWQGVVTARYGAGLTPEENAKAKEHVLKLLALWEVKMKPVKVMLEHYRDTALLEVDQELLPKSLKGRKVGRISNKHGRTRLFDLEHMSKSAIGSIRRQAGNFPIQSFARELYCLAMCQLSEALVRENLMDIKIPDSTRATGYRFKNKVNIMAHVHDESLMSVDADVNHKFLYKLIVENCMLELEGYPTFFCGIGVGKSWDGAKNDFAEAPVTYVKEQVATNPPKFINEDINQVELAAEGIKKYYVRRIGEELAQLDPRTLEGYFDMQVLVPKFKNYFVKPKVAEYIGLHREVMKTDYDDFAVASIETYALYTRERSVIRDMYGIETEYCRAPGEYSPLIPVQQNESSDFEFAHETLQGLDLLMEDNDIYSDESVAVVEGFNEFVDAFESNFVTTSTAVDWKFGEG